MKKAKLLEPIWIIQSAINIFRRQKRTIADVPTIKLARLRANLQLQCSQMSQKQEQAPVRLKSFVISSVNCSRLRKPKFIDIFDITIIIIVNTTNERRKNLIQHWAPSFQLSCLYPQQLPQHSQQNTNWHLQHYILLQPPIFWHITPQFQQGYATKQSLKFDFNLSTKELSSLRSNKPELRCNGSSHVVPHSSQIRSWVHSMRPLFGWICTKPMQLQPSLGQMRMSLL